MLSFRFALPLTGAALALAGLGLLRPVAASAAGQQQLGAFNAEQKRPPEDAAAVARGKSVYAVSCQSCHGADLRGGDLGGPNLLRRQSVMLDQHGERLLPIHGNGQAPGAARIDLSKADSEAVAAYLRSMAAMIGSQGRPPGEPGQLKPVSVLAGQPAAGKVFFDAHCASCHSAADMKKVATANPEPKALQNRWVAGGGARFAASAASRVTASVQTAPGKTMSGALLAMDDFQVTLRMDDGTQKTFGRNGVLPKVEVHDPMQGHRDLLPLYTSTNIHDVTAYLVSLK